MLHRARTGRNSCLGIFLNHTICKIFPLQPCKRALFTPFIWRIRRKAIDPDLPRVEETLDIPESEKVCACGEKMTKIGEETSERLETGVQ